MSRSLDEECDRMLYSGVGWRSDITARCRVVGGGFVAWKFGLRTCIGRGIVLNVGTWRKSRGHSYDVVAAA